MRASAGKRILMLLENSHFPQDPRVRREAYALRAAGYPVSVICPAKPHQPWYEVLNGVRVYRYAPPREMSGAIGYVWEYAYSMAATLVFSLLVLVRDGFDVLHAANPPDTFVLIAMLYKPFGKAFVYDHHDLAPEMYRARFGKGGRHLIFQLQVWLEQLSCRLADHVIATNESYRQVEMTRGGVPAERITVVRNGPELDLLQARGADGQLKGMGKTIIAFAGVMSAQDGVDYLLRALKHLVHDLGRTDFFCLLIGGLGDAQPYLRCLATRLDLAKHVCFTGWVSDEDYLRYLCTADICVAPDPSNAFTDRSTMIKVMEYMALEKPIVAFDLPEHRYSAQAAAMYVPPNDELAFARSLAHLMDHPEQRIAMGRYGHQRVAECLDWSYSVPSLLSVYRRLGSV
ncbi:MAG: glycosyltransferase family 4 protein [Chloroflexi bacterium]|nr:glycosyltransferase family 4 protein [Chloroflexota bacterium]